MINSVINLSRINKQLIMLFIDSVLLVSILLISFSIRLGYWYFPQSDLIWVIFGAPVIAGIIFMRFGLYRAVIRYIGFKALWAIVQAVSLYALVWGVIGFMVAVDGIPRSVILINWVLSLLAIGGVRIFARALLSENANFKFFTPRALLSGRMFNGELNSQSDKKRVLVYGAGDAGIQLVSALVHSSEYNPVGFVDDSNELQGNHIRGLNIYSVEGVANVITMLKVDEVLIAMPSASRTKRLDIINRLEPYPVFVRILPGVSELAQGKIKVEHLRTVGVNDLLGREPIKPDKFLLQENTKNMVVMVTGAGGSIGSEICRQVIKLGASKLILYEQSELALYTIEAPS